jgi:hypothetical protein
MPNFKIPVVFQMWGLVDVEAETIEEAFKYATEHIPDLPLPEPGKAEYVDDSYQIDGDLDHVKTFNEVKG